MSYFPLLIGSMCWLFLSSLYVFVGAMIIMVMLLDSGGEVAWPLLPGDRCSHLAIWDDITDMILSLILLWCFIYYSLMMMIDEIIRVLQRSRDPVPITRRRSWTAFWQPLRRLLLYEIKMSPLFLSWLALFMAMMINAWWSRVSCLVMGLMAM